MDQQENEQIITEEAQAMRNLMSENTIQLYHKLRTIREIIRQKIKADLGVEMLCAKVACGMHGASRTVYYCDDEETGPQAFFDFETHVHSTKQTLSMRITFDLKDFLTSKQFLKNKKQQDDKI